jgi:hypothetical protein
MRDSRLGITTIYFPDEQLVGFDQSANHWVMAQNMGAVQWAITQVF